MDQIVRQFHLLHQIVCVDDSAAKEKYAGILAANRNFLDVQPPD